MTLRARLLLSLGVLLAVALVVTGGLVVGLTRQSLVQQLDEDLRNASPADRSLGNGPGPGPDEPTGRRFALLVYGLDGEQLRTIPSGLANNPDPLPALPDGGISRLEMGQIIERPSLDGAVAYRLLAFRGRVEGGLDLNVIGVLAAPMTGVDQSVAVVIRTLVVVGLVVLGAMLLIGTWIIRRGLRPLEQITATATRISGGDLSSRVGVRDDGSEVGRLGNAFDGMLDQIQGAFASQAAALESKDRSESKLRQFVADASHELRTPLTTVRGYAELYGAGGLSEEAALAQAMARIGTESRRMAALVEDLLLLARLDQGRPLRADPVLLSELVNDAVADARAVEPDRPVAAHVEDGVVVRGDEDRLRQVIGNLLGNVRMHTPAEVAVDVALSSRDGVAALSVSDHGPGIDAEHAAQIFDRFYRVDSGRSRERG
ncbi:MAG TPA: histidine kinase dimerization/phospho-acceptor domain-containing protein, partial [Candidatus Limnocylindrales bacterium]|nr:histidine kinase dimerization/phospho-acceptor domain-containing protein [Candidatus Limnocylindrales bacterium]